MTRHPPKVSIKRRISIISISSGDESPKKRRSSVISISSGDEIVTQKPVHIAEKSLANRRENAGFYSDGLAAIARESEVRNAKEIEIMRGWVDEGIANAIREMSGQKINISQSIPPIQVMSHQTPTAQTTQYHSPSASNSHSSAMLPQATPTHRFHQTYPPTSFSQPAILNQSSYDSSCLGSQAMYTSALGSGGRQPPSRTAQACVSAQHQYPPLQTSSTLLSQRVPLGPVTNNLPLSITTTSEAIKLNAFLLRPQKYLSYGELENLYLPPGMDRSMWIVKVGLEEPVFSRLWVSDYKKQEAEDTWASKLAMVRRGVEVKAVNLRHNENFSAGLLPLRPVPETALPLSFAKLEWHFFNIPERKLTGYDATITKRTLWLKDLGLIEQEYYRLCKSQEEGRAVENVYSTLSLAARRSVEEKAAYLNVMLSPPIPLWADFEEEYCLHENKLFSNSKGFDEKRKEWLAAIDLNHQPFCFQASETESGVKVKERTEVAWSMLGPQKRLEIMRKAAELDDSRGDITWDAFESAFGYCLEDFAGDRSDYAITRRAWLKSIGITDTIQSLTSLQNMWSKKSLSERREIMRKGAKGRAKLLHGVVKRRKRRSAEMAAAKKSLTKKKNAAKTPKQSTGRIY